MDIDAEFAKLRQFRERAEPVLKMFENVKSPSPAAEGEPAKTHDWLDGIMTLTARIDSVERAVADLSEVVERHLPPPAPSGASGSVPDGQGAAGTASAG